jgi:hypothetical protein
LYSKNIVTFIYRFYIQGKGFIMFFYVHTGTNRLTAEFLVTFTLVSLSTRLTDQTLTMIDNIFTNTTWEHRWRPAWKR